MPLLFGLLSLAKRQNGKSFRPVKTDKEFLEALVDLAAAKVLHAKRALNDSMGVQVPLQWPCM